MVLLVFSGAAVILIVNGQSTTTNNGDYTDSDEIAQLRDQLTNVVNGNIRLERQITAQSETIGQLKKLLSELSGKKLNNSILLCVLPATCVIGTFRKYTCNSASRCYHVVLPSGHIKRCTLSDCPSISCLRFSPIGKWQHSARQK